MKKSFVIVTIIVLSISLTALLVQAAISAVDPGWIQVNSDGFGDARNLVKSLEVYNGQLYAGTWGSEDGHPAQIWRASDGKTWNQVSPPWAATNGVAFDMQPFNNQLYVGTANDNGGEIWRSSDGSTWEQVVASGFGDANNSIRTFDVFSNTVLVATANITTGVEIWSSSTGNNGSWTQVNANGFGYGTTAQDVTMDVFNGSVYVGLGRDSSGTAELWQSNDGITWTSVFTDGLGNANNTHVASMEEYNGYFYIGLRNTNDGGEVWRSSDGTDWTTVFAGGNGNSDNQRPYGLTTFNGNLYLTMNNSSTGVEIWESTDGISWQVIADNGWGDSGNFFADYFDNGNAVFNGGLYIGTLNFSTGGEIWLYLANKVFLPVVVR